MDVSKNHGTPKSSILVGFSIKNHPFWGTPIFGNMHIYIYTVYISFSEEVFTSCPGNYPSIPQRILDLPLKIAPDISEQLLTGGCLRLPNASESGSGVFFGGMWILWSILSCCESLERYGMCSLSLDVI